MTHSNDERDEAEILRRGVEGLNAATRRALESGRPVVLVRDGQLVRITGDEVLVLKELPEPVEVPERLMVRDP